MLIFNLKYNHSSVNFSTIKITLLLKCTSFGSRLSISYSFSELLSNFESSVFNIRKYSPFVIAKVTRKRKKQVKVAFYLCLFLTKFTLSVILFETFEIRDGSYFTKKNDYATMSLYDVSLNKR